MKDVGYYNGVIQPADEMMIPANDRAVYFGDGVYEAVLVANKKPFAFDDHIERFYQSCELIRINFTMKPEELKSEIMKCVAEADDDNVMIYWQASRGTEKRHHDFPAPSVKPNLLITVRPKEMPSLEKKLALITVEDTRFLHCDMKTLNLLPSVLANQKAMEAGCDEAVFHRGNIVTECSHSNIFIIKDGKVITHMADNLILHGISRKHLINITSKLNIPLEERAFTVDELYDADEIIVSASGVLCRSAYLLNGKEVGGKAPELYKRITDAYKEEFFEVTGYRL